MLSEETQKQLAQLLCAEVACNNAQASCQKDCPFFDTGTCGNYSKELKALAADPEIRALAGLEPK